MQVPINGPVDGTHDKYMLVYVGISKCIRNNRTSTD